MAQDQELLDGAMIDLNREWTKEEREKAENQVSFGGAAAAIGLYGRSPRLAWGVSVALQCEVNALLAHAESLEKELREARDLLIQYRLSHRADPGCYETDGSICDQADEWLTRNAGLKQEDRENGWTVYELVIIVGGFACVAALIVAACVAIHFIRKIWTA